MRLFGLSNTLIEFIHNIRRNANRRKKMFENGRVTFGYVGNNNQIVEVKIPLDGIEVDEVNAEPSE